MREKLKITIIGAGSVVFCPLTVNDIIVSEKLNTRDIEISLMDIDQVALDVSFQYAQKAIKLMDSNIVVTQTLDLRESLKDTDFVITAIEKERYYYWSLDFNLPRNYGFRQIYGENGGPGGMFHYLRNIVPMLEIARAMEEICPNAFLLNYTNPEAKIVETLSKLTSIRVVGICHGYEMGATQIKKLLGCEREDFVLKAYGLNHFGLITELTDAKTGEDLYPTLKQKEAETHWLAEFDDFALSRMMYRTYGYFPYPGSNHIGEYVAWSDQMIASPNMNYFFDPVRGKYLNEFDKHPSFVYSFERIPEDLGFDYKEPTKEDAYKKSFNVTKEDIKFSGEYGITIIEAIIFDENIEIPSLNVLNNGAIPYVKEDMCVEVPCIVNKTGFHPVSVERLPLAWEAMINQQGYIHQLLMESFINKDRNLLLQAMLLDPTISNYQNAVKLIDEMFEIQKEILPEMSWK